MIGFFSRRRLSSSVVWKSGTDVLPLPMDAIEWASEDAMPGSPSFMASSLALALLALLHFALNASTASARLMSSESERP